MTQIILNEAPDRLFVAQKLRNLFKRNHDDDDGLLSKISNCVAVPLNIMRDYTVPMGEVDSWDRNRAAIVTITMPAAFVILMGFIDLHPEEEGDPIDIDSLIIGLWWFIPGAILALLVKFRTKVTEPPPRLFTLYSILAFIMSIAWINMTSEFVVAMLKLFGYMTGIPFPLLQLTILAWGNCLGDMSADVAMTKKGFGEMAITATIAGPVFNTLIGMSLSNFASYLKNQGAPNDYAPNVQ